VLTCHLPSDLLKVRAQAINPATGRPFYHYPNPWKALGQIYSQEGGFAALYRWDPTAVGQVRLCKRAPSCHTISIIMPALGARRDEQDR
jgi:hypothetical protein